MYLSNTDQVVIGTDFGTNYLLFSFTANSATPTNSFVNTIATDSAVLSISFDGSSSIYVVGYEFIAATPI